MSPAAGSASGSLPFHSVLVTGASGFVGRRLVPRLREALPEDAAMHLCGRESAEGHNAVDLLDPSAVSRVVEAAAPDLVIHLAAQSSVGQSTSQAAETWQVNVAGTMNLATAVARAAPHATVLFVSSAEVYGAAFNDGPVTESTPAQPRSPYGRSKLAAEMAMADLLGPDNRLVLVRPSNHSGAGQDARFVLPSFARQIAQVRRGESEATLRVGNLEAERDFLHVDDVVSAYVALLANAGDLKLRSTYNVASGHPRRIGDLLQRLIDLAQIDVQVERDPGKYRPNDIARTDLDTSALRAATGWRPMITVDAMLAELLAAA